MEKGSGNFILMISLVVIFLSILTLWFTISSFKTTSFAVKEPIQSNFEDKPLLGPPIFRFVNFNPSDILSGESTLGVQVNNSKLEELGLYLVYHGNLYNIDTIKLLPDNKFYSITFNTSEFPNQVCDYRFLIGIKTSDGLKYSTSEPFSILNGYRPSNFSYNYVNHTDNENGNKIFYSLKAKYLDYVKGKIRINRTEVYINPDFHCFVKTPYKIIFNNISFIKPKLMINGKTHTSLCTIKSYENNKLEVQSYLFGSIKVFEGFKFGMKLFTPSLENNKYVTNQNIPFTVFLTDKFNKKRDGHGIDCNATFIVGGNKTVRVMKYNNLKQDYFTSVSFNRKGVFDWVVNCINLSSGYQNIKGGKFRVQ